MRKLQYFPYTALTKAARTKHVASNVEHLVHTTTGLALRQLDRASELFISAEDWIAVSHIVEEHIARFHGSDYHQAFVCHHHNVIQIADDQHWTIAMGYDIAQRLALGRDASLDLGAKNSALVTNLLQAGLSKFQTAYPSVPPPPSPTKRPAPYSFSDHSPKRHASETAVSASHGAGIMKCFRCGLGEHLPENCSATQTSAGMAPAALSPDPQSLNGLIGPGNQPYCFSWAAHAYCHYSSACAFLHGCSICNSPSHGAGTCSA